jgi:hypothetical protein
MGHHFRITFLSLKSNLYGLWFLCLRNEDNTGLVPPQKQKAMTKKSDIVA